MGNGAKPSAPRGTIFASFLWFMLPAEILTPLALAGLLRFSDPGATGVMAPFLIVWAISPLIAYWVSKPRLTETRGAGQRRSEFARPIARRTWRFFESVCRSGRQLVAAGQLSGRSVTGYGSSHVADKHGPVVAVHVGGSRSRLSQLARIRGTPRTHVCHACRKLATSAWSLLQLVRHEDSQPLLPQYISTVDSGNLAGHLIALKQACIELPDRKLFRPRIMEGLTDTLDAIGFETERISRPFVNEPKSLPSAICRRDRSVPATP